MQEFFWIIIVLFLISWAIRRSMIKSPLYYLLRHLLNKTQTQQGQQSSRRSSSSELAVQPMVCCAYCHVYIPETDAIREGSLYFCSKQHQKVGHRS